MSAITQIEEIDQELGLVRKSWMEAAPSEKGRWINMINRLLDDRLKLMAKRDSKPS